MKQDRAKDGRVAYRAEGDEDAELVALFESTAKTHVPEMHKCLDAAISILRHLMSAKAEVVPEEVRENLAAAGLFEDDNMGINMKPAFEAIEKDFGIELSTEARDEIFGALLSGLLAEGGVSFCVAWNIAHVIEHKTRRALN